MLYKNIISTYSIRLHRDSNNLQKAPFLLGTQGMADEPVIVVFSYHSLGAWG